MRTMMKYGSAALLLGLSQLAIADYGPYHVQIIDDCNQQTIYMNDYGVLYGSEVGCGDFYGYTYTGYYGGGDSFTLVRATSSDPTGEHRLYVYTLSTGVVDTWAVDGGSSSYISSQNFQFADY